MSEARKTASVVKIRAGSGLPDVMLEKVPDADDRIFSTKQRCKYCRG